MSVSAERLRLLRRQAGETARPGAAGTPGTPAAAPAPTARDDTDGGDTPASAGTPAASPGPGRAAVSPERLRALRRQIGQAVPERAAIEPPAARASHLPQPGAGAPALERLADSAMPDVPGAPGPAAGSAGRAPAGNGLVRRRPPGPERPRPGARPADRAGHGQETRAAGGPGETPAVPPRVPGPAAAPAPAAVAATAPGQGPVRPATPADASVFAWVEREVRHAPAAVPTPAPRPDTPARAGMGSLRRLLGLRERAVPGQGTPARTLHGDRHLPGREIAPGLHLIEAFLPQPIPRQALSLAFARREDAVDPRQLLFFDTETTGLAGGTGTRAFMIGAADWHLDAEQGMGLRVRQLMISTMAAESAMLDAFTAWLAADTVLSSYNGRSYDAPLLKTRYRLARRGDPLSALDHVDLLHPTRRRYRGTWENCKLATIERQLLRVVREEDLPGSEAPAAWLGFLRGGSARNLRRVAEHNHQDVVTLSLLLQRLVAAEAEERALPPCDG